MPPKKTTDGITESDIESTYKVLETLRQNFQDNDITGFAETVNEAHYLVQQYDSGANWNSHKFDIGDRAIDDKGPTRSPEKNLVEIVELIDKPANEFVVENDKTVSEYKNNRFYPEDDMVVAAVYINLNDKIWHFPESRLRPV